MIGKFLGPVILITIGVLFLLNNIGFHLPLGAFFRDAWPFLLILLGALQIARHFSTGFGARHGTLTGGIILITVGFLFVLQQWADIRFRDTWPVLLIVIGAAGLLRFTLPGIAGRSRGGIRE